MVPYLIRAWSTYIRTHSFHHTHTHARTHAHTTQPHTHTHALTHTHTHTHYKYMHYWWWVGTMWRKKMTDQYAEEKRWVFSFDWKEAIEDNCLTLTRRGREFQITGPMYWKDLSPRVLLPILGTRNIRGWAKRAGRRVDIKQLREVWRSCTRDNVEADERYCVVNPFADW